MDLTAALVVGGVIGWVVGMLMEISRKGVLANAFAGAVGAFVLLATATALGIPATSAHIACVVGVLGATPPIGLLYYLGTFRVSKAW
jgi:uncharacterized membrane protein YeaQ/YmgE (transglycosylase-associated protein family)